MLSALRPSLTARRIGLRLALFALLVSAMVPTFSRLLQPVGLDEWSALCQVASPDGDRGVPSAPQDVHADGDACALCTLAHILPMLGGAALPAVAVVAYAPPSPAAPTVVRTRVVQTRAPGARAPPTLG